MMLTGHIVASSVTSIAFYGATKSWPGTLACFLSGILIDLDHVLDYCVIRKKFFCTLKELKDFCLNDKSGEIYLFLHSYELMALLWAAFFYFHLNIIWLGVFTGVSVHLALDQMANDIYPLAYFISYRYRVGFTKLIFFKDDFLREFKRGGRHDSKQ